MLRSFISRWRSFSTANLTWRSFSTANVNKLSSCEGCGATFQSQFADQQGFINPGKMNRWKEILDKREFKEQSIAEPETLTSKTSQDPVSAEDSEWMNAYHSSLFRHYSPIDKNVRTPNQMVSDAVDFRELQQRRKEKQLLEMPRCDRCHQLSHHGYTQGTLETVHAKDFRPLLAKHLHIKSPRGAILLKMIDVFDFEGTLVPDFHEIVGGTHEVILVANKVDILPLPRIRVNKLAGHNRLTAWIKARLKALNVHLRLHSVSVISSRTGAGIDVLMKKVMRLVDNHPGQTRDVYVVGATNVGKSSFINHLIAKKFITAGRLTTAAAPGTTLGVVQFGCSELRNGLPKIRLFDTPGVVNQTSLARLLTYDELRAVLPKKRLHAFSVRVSPGRSIFLGAMARVDYVSGYTGCFFTLYVSDDVNVHITKTDRAADVYANYAATGNQAQGFFLSPPYSADRLPVVGLGANLDDSAGNLINLKGRGWREAVCDIVFPGLGWISVTGSEAIQVRAFCNPRSSVSVREPMFPSPDIKGTTKRYTGSDPRHLNRVQTLRKTSDIRRSRSNG